MTSEVYSSGVQKLLSDIVYNWQRVHAERRINGLFWSLSKRLFIYLLPQAFPLYVAHLTIKLFHLPLSYQSSSSSIYFCVLPFVWHVFPLLLLVCLLGIFLLLSCSKPLEPYFHSFLKFHIILITLDQVIISPYSWNILLNNLPLLRVY